MGTTVSLRAHWLPDRSAGALLEAIRAEFERLDRRFSLYRPDSELSAVASGEQPLTTASDDMRSMYAEALAWRSATSGSFTPHRPDGVIDLNGLVKAKALECAGGLLRASGAAGWCVNAGGDITCDGVQEDGGGWRVGIVDPEDRTRLLSAVELGGPWAAIATSGTAERGEHIWRASAVTDAYQSVTVLAADIVTADVLATAILASGPSGLDDVTAQWPIDVLTVATSGQLTVTPRLRNALTPATTG